MNFPSISIIIPVFNVGPYVEDCIRSVMRQTYTGPLECIIIDDCGTDDSMMIVERLISNYNGHISFHIHRHTHNLGLSAARNTGMQYAYGEYIFFLDSDDEITDECIDILVKQLEIKRFDVVEGLLLDSYGKSHKEYTKESVALFSPYILQEYKKKWGVPACNKLYRFSFLQENQLRFKEGIIHEDVLWSFQVACIATSLCVVNTITYLYNRREGSITTLDIEGYREESRFIILREMSAFASSHGANSKDTFRLFSRVFYETINYYSSEPKLFVETYKSLRPLFHVSILSIFKKNRHSIKGFLYDFHYILPICVAPYWQYIIYYRLCPLIKQK